MTNKRCYKISSQGLEKKKEGEKIRENPTGGA